MPDIGTPHPVTAHANVFTGTDGKADVGEPADLGAREGTAHSTHGAGYQPVYAAAYPAMAEPGVFTGTDPNADVGKPGGVA